MSRASNVSDAILSTLRGSLVFPDLSINRLRNLEQTDIEFESLPFVLVLFTERTAREPRRTGPPPTTGQQNEDWTWELYIGGQDPDDCSSGDDIFTVLDSVQTALQGAQVASTASLLTLEGERLYDVLPGGLVYVQTWKHWLQGGIA
jgi:hypothetical protein